MEGREQMRRLAGVRCGGATMTSSLTVQEQGKAEAVRTRVHHPPPPSNKLTVRIIISKINKLGINRFRRAERLNNDKSRYKNPDESSF